MIQYMTFKQASRSHTRFRQIDRSHRAPEKANCLETYSPKKKVAYLAAFLNVLETIIHFE